MISLGLLAAIPLFLSVMLFAVCLLGLLVLLWPCYFLIIDKKTGVLESFSVGGKMGLVNLGLTCQLALATFGIMLLGILACGVGLFVTTAYASVLWSSAYLMIRGEIR